MLVFSDWHRYCERIDMLSEYNLTRRMFLKHTALIGAGLSVNGCLGSNQPLSRQEPTNMPIIRNQSEDVENIAHIDKLDELVGLFKEMMLEGLHPGSQLAAYRNGKLMIELAGGYIESGGPQVVPQTLYQMRSTTKALTAISMLMLYDRGHFAFEDPVMKHWPEFGANGKETITIAHIMSHRAGIPDGPMITARQMGNRVAIVKAVENMAPIWPPGTANGYHAASYGWVLDELVQRWDGRNVGQFIQEEVVQKLGLKDVFIGLPASEFPRMAKMIVDDGVRSRQPLRARFSDFLNTPEGIGLPLAWVGGMATAADLAHLMNILAFEGNFAATSFFKKETLTMASKPQNEPDAIDRRLRSKIHWGLGFMLGSTPGLVGNTPKPLVVGHAGGSATIAWADPAERLTTAFLCNTMIDMSTAFERYRKLGNSIYACLRS